MEEGAEPDDLGPEPDDGVRGVGRPKSSVAPSLLSGAGVPHAVQKRPGGGICVPHAEQKDIKSGIQSSASGAGPRQLYKDVLV